MKTKYKKFKQTLITSAFDVSTIAILIAATAGKQIKIVEIHLTNNSTTEDQKVRLVSLAPTTDYYGGETGSIYLTKRGGNFGLPLSHIPWFEINSGKSLILDPNGSDKISGTVT